MDDIRHEHLMPMKYPDMRRRQIYLGITRDEGNPPEMMDR